MLEVLQSFRATLNDDKAELLVIDDDAGKTILLGVVAYFRFVKWTREVEDSTETIEDVSVV